MYQQWDYLMAKKLLINCQEIIKLLKKNKENCYLSDLYKKMYSFDFFKINIQKSKAEVFIIKLNKYL